MARRKRGISVREVAKTNPNVDEKKIREALRILRDLSKAGIEDSRYNIEPPFTRRFDSNLVTDLPLPNIPNRP
jgi:D-mannonate dehydratase